jgi:hypothetical protein
MRLEDIIGLDYSVEENKAKIRKALSKTKWLERFEPEEITIEKLSSLYMAVTKKYPGRIAYIQHASEKSMVAMIKNTKTSAWIESIHFIDWFECVAKVLLVLYGYFVLETYFKDRDRGE